MSPQRAEIEACVRQWLEDLVDETLVTAGFRRTRKSLIYSREVGEAVQKIDVAIEHHPKDGPDSAAAISPDLEVRMDSVNSLVMEMVDRDPTLNAAPGITLREPIAFTSGNKGLGARWFIYQPDSVPGVIAEMKAFLQKWTIPFLDSYTTPAQICKAYDRGDGRVLPGLRQWLRVVAAMLLCGRNGDALSVMERHFGKLGPRRQYHRVFEYLEARNR